MNDQPERRKIRYRWAPITVVLSLVLVLSTFLFAFNNKAYAMGDPPTNCPNRYDATITSMTINNGTQTLDPIANPGITVDAQISKGYDVTFMLHTVNESSQNNTLHGSTWYHHSAFGFGNGQCVSNAGPNQDIPVAIHIGESRGVPDGTTQDVDWGSLPQIYQIKYKVVWHSSTSPPSHPPAPADFAISANPSSLNVQAGTSGTSTITVASANGFNSTVSLNRSPGINGVTTSFNPNPVALSSLAGSASSTLAISAASDTAPGTYQITVTGTSGTLSHSSVISLTVSGASPSSNPQQSPGTTIIQQPRPAIPSNNQQTTAATVNEEGNATATMRGTIGSVSFVNKQLYIISGNWSMTIKESSTNKADFAANLTMSSIGGNDDRFYSVTSSDLLSVNGPLSFLLASDNGTTISSLTSQAMLAVKGVVDVKEQGSTGIATSEAGTGNMAATISAGRLFDEIKLELEKNFKQPIYGTVDSVTCNGDRTQLIEYVDYGWISFPKRLEPPSAVPSSCMNLLQ